MRNYEGLKKQITYRPILSSLLLLLFSFGAAHGSDYLPPRVAYLEGTAAYEPAGNVDWDEVTVNLPLLSGDRIFTHPSSRTEIELGEANFVRLAEETDLVFAQVSDKEMILLLHTGDMIVRVNNSQKFQIRTPQGTVYFRKQGVYRLRVREDGRALLLVREGKAEFHTPAGKEKLKSGEQIAYGPNATDMAQAVYMDSFETWSDRRDARLVSVRSTSYVGGRYYAGVVDLDYYGNWIYDPAYGNMWVPHTAFTVGWTPFRVGRWGYLSFGWTWLSSEPWGWLPYHYGNWVYYGPGNHWCWVPGGFHHWSPHRVNFYFGGGYVGWAPHGYSPWGWGGGHNTYIDNRNVVINNNTTVINNNRGRGGTVVREDEFGNRQRVRNINNPDETRVRNLQAGLPRNLESPTVRSRSSAIDRGRSMADRGTASRPAVRRDNAATQTGTNRSERISGSRNVPATPGIRSVPRDSSSGTARYRTPSSRSGGTVRPNSGVRSTRPSVGSTSRPNSRVQSTRPSVNSGVRSIRPESRNSSRQNPAVLPTRPNSGNTSRPNSGVRTNRPNSVSRPPAVRSTPRSSGSSSVTGRIQTSPRPVPRVGSTPNRSSRPSVSQPRSTSPKPSYRAPSRSSSRPSVSRPSIRSSRPSVSRPSRPSSRPSVSRPSAPSSRPAAASRPAPASRPKRPN